MNEYLYVLSNPSFPGRLKIGWTIDVETRISQLFTTGVPTPFEVEFVVAVHSGREAERLAHTVLHKQRVAGNREFFALSVSVAVAQIIATIGEHRVVVDRQAAIKQAKAESAQKKIGELHAKIFRLTERSAVLEQQIEEVTLVEKEAAAKCRFIEDSLASHEHRLKQLGPRPLRATSSWVERLSGRAREYDQAYAAHVKLWDEAEAILFHTRAALAKSEADLSKLRSASQRPMLRREWETVAIEVQELKTEIRRLQDSLS